MSEKVSSSKVLMDVLEDFGRCEPDTVVVAYTNSDNEVCFASNMTYPERIGIAEWLKTRTLERMRGQS